MQARLVFYRYAGKSQQCVAAIVGPRGYKFTRAVWIDVPIRLRKLRNDEANRYSRDIHKPNAKRAAREMLQAGKRLGITKGARTFLREVVRA